MDLILFRPDWLSAGRLFAFKGAAGGIYTSVYPKIIPVKQNRRAIWMFKQRFRLKGFSQQGRGHCVPDPPRHLLPCHKAVTH